MFDVFDIQCERMPLRYVLFLLLFWKVYCSGAVAMENLSKFQFCWMVNHLAFNPAISNCTLDGRREKNCYSLDPNSGNSVYTAEWNLTFIRKYVDLWNGQWNNGKETSNNTFRSYRTLFIQIKCTFPLRHESHYLTNLYVPYVLSCHQSKIK